MARSWMALMATVWILGASSACNTAARACEDFVAAVEECEGAPDDHYNQDWCAETVDRGCEDREYFECLENNLECVDGNASTRPILCEVAADVACPGS